MLKPTIQAGIQLDALECCAIIPTLLTHGTLLMKP